MMQKCAAMTLENDREQRIGEEEAKGYQSEKQRVGKH